MKKKKNKNEKKQSYSSKPSARWYKITKVLFGVFLGLVVFRMLLFIMADGKIRTDDIWFRILFVSFGTLLAWWYVKKRK